MATIDPKTVTFDPSAFRAWLEQANGGEVGMACDSNTCPVARWLHAQYGVDFYVSPYDDTAIDGSGDGCCLDLVPVSTPEWVRRFVREVDRRAAFCHASVDGRTALEVLDTLLSGGGE